MSHNTSHGGASHGSVKSYTTGFILSVILTVIPFWIVMEGALPQSTIILDCSLRGCADPGAVGLFPAYEHQIGWRLEYDRICFHGADHRYHCRRFTVDHVPPEP